MCVCVCVCVTRKLFLLGVYSFNIVRPYARRYVLFLVGVITTVSYLSCFGVLVYGHTLYVK